jgi:hypothetical protein
MANTKKMTREERKTSKRTARKSLKLTLRKLTPKQRAEFDGKKKGGVKGFLLGTNQENE